MTLLVGAISVPNEPVIEHLLERPDVLTARRANNGRVIDADSECIGLSIGIFRNDDEPVSNFRKTVEAESLLGCEPLLYWLEKGETNASLDYYRYWHGYLIVARPLLSVLSYNDVRGILFTLSVGLLGLLAWRVGHHHSALAGLSVLLPFMFLNGLGYWIVVTKAVGWFVIVIASLYVVRQKNDDPPLLAFFFAGAATVVLDFLNAPLLSLAMPAFLWFFFRSARSFSDNLKIFLAMSGFWFAGYIGLWIAKFMVASLVLDGPVWADVIGSVTNRLRGQSHYIDSFLPGMALYKNLASLKTLWGPATIIMFVVAPLLSARGRQGFITVWRDQKILVVIAAVPLLWLELLSNHSQIHAAFTHLNFAPALMLSSLCLLGCMDRKQQT